jgi:alkylhydroperoxidase/carboxymuconolactone decarboxylase family protein YurZ
MGKPAFMTAIEKGDPELMKQLASVQGFVMKEGALSTKVKVLMSLFGDAMLGHDDGVEALAAQARALGATEAEINETVRMTFYFGGIPALVTATRAFRK